MAAGAAVFPEEVLPWPQPSGSATMAREAKPLARLNNSRCDDLGARERDRDLILMVNAKGTQKSQKNDQTIRP
jgi:hypothetical protein